MTSNSVDRLRWLLDEVDGRLGATSALDSVAATDFEYFLVSTCWLERASQQARAILVLIENDLHASVGPMERALWELWIEWRFLKAFSDRRSGAAKVILTSKIEALEFGEKQPEFRVEVLDRLRADIVSLSELYPNAYAELQSQRRAKPKRFHWSGESYSAMERALVSESAMYKILSWDAHGTLALISNLRLKRTGSTHFTAEFGRSEADPMADPERIAWSAGGVLYYMYYDWSELCGLPPITMPPA